jgi:hypothetical protein
MAVSPSANPTFSKNCQKMAKKVEEVAEVGKKGQK